MQGSISSFNCFKLKLVFHLKLFKFVEICHFHDSKLFPVFDDYTHSTQVSRYQKGKANLDFSEARDSEWQWHQLGHMQVCTLLQTDYHTSTPPLFFVDYVHSISCGKLVTDC